MTDKSNRMQICRRKWRGRSRRRCSKSGMRLLRSLTHGQVRAPGQLNFQTFQLALPWALSQGSYCKARTDLCVSSACCNVLKRVIHASLLQVSFMQVSCRTSDPQLIRSGTELQACRGAQLPRRWRQEYRSSQAWLCCHKVCHQKACQVLRKVRKAA
jgi:hypothetical protein